MLREDGEEFFVEACSSERRLGAIYEELLPILTKQDLQLLEVLRQEALNKELLNWIVEGELTPPEQEPEQSYEVDYSGEAAEALSPEIIRLQALQAVSAAANQGKRNPRPKVVPDYISRFVYDLYHREVKSDEQDSSEAVAPRLFDEIGSDRLALEDLIASYYYDSVADSRQTIL